ncbi:MAG: CAP domain-containing protein [Pedobacter sp.]|uniref:CAP domain-containing protein n=1 Tax=Pedobacter sp. TaxID=1411316 RepID=UPI003396A73C
MKFTSILFFLLIFSSFASKAQSSNNMWTQEELDNANTARNTDYLNEEEKQIVFYMNLARTDGRKFFETYFQDFADAYNVDMQRYSNYNDLKVNRKDKYYRGLQEDLMEIKDLPLFSPDETLTWIAQQHAKDLSKNNKAGHNSTDGRTVKDRISKFYPRRAMAENLAFGFSKGLANVCMLLLDKNVPDLGHRKTILGTGYNLSLVGVNIRTHPGYRYCAVIDFISAPPAR